MNGTHNNNDAISDWMDGWMDGWKDGWKDGWTDGWMDGWMAGWMEGWMDGWMDGFHVVVMPLPPHSMLVHQLPANTFRGKVKSVLVTLVALLHRSNRLHRPSVGCVVVRRTRHSLTYSLTSALAFTRALSHSINQSIHHSPQAGSSHPRAWLGRNAW